MIPPRPHESATGSEKQVFSLIHKLSPGVEAIALTSLNLAEHEYKRWGEIDFVLILPQGIFVIEVKGGKVSARNGIWSFEDRLGRRIEKAESPMSQAQSGFSSILNKYLIPHFGSGLINKGIGGFCVVFPKTTKIEASYFIGGPEMPEELVATKEDCVDARTFNSFILRVVNYWKNHSRTTKPGWSPVELRNIVTYLRPSFDRVPPLSLALTKTREEQLALTEEQYHFLDYLETAPRILCIGGAGCGKTFLAVESLRREMDNNAVLVTGTSSLAKYLRKSNVPEPNRIFSIDEIRQAPPSGKFSVLIVDEGQQITNREDFSCLEKILDKPLSSARWRWFADPNNQLGLSSNFNTSAHDDLQEWATITSSLRVNCRNTPQVVRAVEFATGAVLGSTKVKGDGPEVKYSQGNSPAEIALEAAEQIKEWVVPGEVDPGQIILLSPLPIQDSSIPTIAKLAGFGFAPWKAGWDQDPKYPRVLAAANIDEFRGLESPFVILCDLGGELSSLETELYLGMTRANFGLFVSCTKESRELLVTTRLAMTPRA